MKLLFVVHRSAPYAGGSEVFVHAMAKESQARGHHVAVFAGEHKGDFEGIHITNNTNILLQNWDLVIVHGSGPSVQNFVLQNAKNIPNPILFMLILPSDHLISIQAMNDCAYLGWSTPADLDHINKCGHNVKAVKVSHGITINNCIGKPGFKEKYNITKRMFLSVGGYWPNKKMRELADVWLQANIQDAVLITTGYDNRNDLMPMPIKDKIIPLLLDDRNDVLSAILEADCYLMHSSEEGFGLVILESMLNKTPWIARHMAGPALLANFGKTYTTDQELIAHLNNFDNMSFDLDAAQNHVLKNHLIQNTINDIEAIAK